MAGTALGAVSGGVQWCLCCILATAAEFLLVFLSILLGFFGAQIPKTSLRRNSGLRAKQRCSLSRNEGLRGKTKWGGTTGRGWIGERFLAPFC